MKITMLIILVALTSCGWEEQQAEFAKQRNAVDVGARDTFELPYRPSGKLIRKPDGSVWYLPQGEKPEQWFSPLRKEDK